MTHKYALVEIRFPCTVISCFASRLAITILVCDTDNHNVISIHSTTVLIHQNISMHRNTSIYCNNQVQHIDTAKHNTFCKLYSSHLISVASQWNSHVYYALAHSCRISQRSGPACTECGPRQHNNQALNFVTCLWWEGYHQVQWKWIHHNWVPTRSFVIAVAAPVRTSAKELSLSFSFCYRSPSDGRNIWRIV